MNIRRRLCLYGFLCLCLGSQLDAEQVESDPRWQQATDLQNQEDYSAAAALYRELFADYPTSQRTSLRIAICEEKDGLTEQALASYDVANAVEPFGYWAEVGLYYQGLLYRDAGSPDKACECIGLLRARFPDSRWTARGEVLDAELDGRDTTKAQQVLATELEAWERFQAANQARSRESDGERIQLLQAVATDFPDSGSALQALDTIGHIHIRNSQREEAIVAFLEIINRAESVAPQSRVVQTAQSRLAGLYHWTRRKEEALELFSHLADHATNPEVASNAALQAAGLHFELLQPKRWRREEVGSDEWAEVRRMCQRVRDLERAQPREMARAELMILETYHWDRQPEECVPRAEAYIESHELPEYREEVSTAHLFAGSSLQLRGQHAEALVHYQWIADEYERAGRISPSTYLNALAHYRVFDALNRSGAPEAEVVAAGEFVLNEFPDTYPAELVRNSLRHRTRSEWSSEP